MASSNLNRLFIGSLLILAVLVFYFINLDLILILILVSFISYDLYYIRILSNYFLIFLIVIVLLSLSFFSFHSFQYLFIFQFIIVLCICFLSKYRKELFILSLYIFCMILFYIINIDRNIFYLLIFVSFFNDTIAYITGRYLRGPLILPNISPKKTWSGTSISFIATTLLLLFFNFEIFISMFISIFLFIGDIFFSFIKRYLNIKDFSLLLASHGGILDRLDSILFGMPVGFLLLIILL